MAELNVSVINVFMPGHSVGVESELILDSYGDITRANIYFDNRLRKDAWIHASIEERKAALTEATELIDRLSFVGTRSNATQIHAFPRNGDLVLLPDIEKACYEIALKLLDGYDPELEIKNLANVSQGFSSVRTTYNRTFALDHIRAGIPSSKAWDLLKPWLHPNLSLKLRRVD